MDSSRFSSGFPVGLRVLLVDNDYASLTALEKMLKKCKYEVTSTSSAEEALGMVGEGKDWFEIVMCDLKENVFKFVEHVHKLNIPVIMSCGDGERSRVMRGVAAGACDYLVKPLRLKEVKNIWQHVLRKKLKEDEHSLDEILNTRNQQTGNRRIRSRENEAESASNKKPRLSWNCELEKKFVQVVNRIGLDKAGPKTILDMMGDTSLTRDNIASHLQKYRLKIREAAAADISPVTQNSAMTMQQNMAFPQQNIQILHNHTAVNAGNNIQPHCFSSLAQFNQYQYQYFPTKYFPHTHPHPAVSNTLAPRQYVTNQLQYNQPPIPSSIDEDLESYVLLCQLRDNSTPPPKMTDLESSFPYTTNLQQQHGPSPVSENFNSDSEDPGTNQG